MPPTVGVVFLLAASVLLQTGNATGPVQAVGGISQWSQFHGDETHSGYSSSTGPTSPLQVWTYDLGGSSDGLVVANGLLIGSSPTGLGIVAFSEASGSEIRVYSGGTSCFYHYGNQEGTSYPSVASGELFFYAASGDPICSTNGIYAVSVSTGTITWNTPAGGGQLSSLYGYDMNSYDNGEVYNVFFNSNALVAYSASSGNLVWQASLPSGSDTVPTVGGGAVVVGFSSLSDVEGFDANSGTSLWNFTTDAPLTDTPAFSNGVFYFGTSAGTFYAISGAGTLLWSTKAGASIETTPAVGLGAVVFGTDSGTLYALNSTTGASIWESNLGSQLVASPAISSNGMVYQVTAGGQVDAFTLASGASAWSYDIGAAVTSSPVLDQGYLFVIDQGGVIHAFTNGGYVNFSESGLPVGTVWGISVSGQVEYGASNVIQAGLVPGSYTYQVLGPNGRWFASWYQITDNSGDLGNFLGTSSWTGSNFSYSWSNTPLFAGYSANVGFVASQTMEIGGTVTISIAHDDGIEVYIDGSAVFGGAELCACPGSQSDTVVLNQGLHLFEVKYYNLGGPGSVMFSVSPNPQDLPVSIPNPASGSFTVSSGNQSVPIKFTNGRYSVFFRETGLPAGVPWQVTLGGSTKSSSTPLISFGDIANGNYSYSIGDSGVYSPAPASGTVTVSGSNVTISTSFARYEFDVHFTENGLPAGAVWDVTLDGVDRSSSTPSIDFQDIANGQHSYIVGVSTGFVSNPTSGTVTVTGANASVLISYVKNTFVTTFEETGLPTGLVWGVSVDSVSHVSSSNTVVFGSLPRGSHAYTVTSPNGYVVSPNRGNFTITGMNVTIMITFAQGWTTSSPPLDVTAAGAVGYVQLSWNPPQSSGAPPGFSGTAVEYYYIFKGNTSGQETYYGKVSGSTLSFTDSNVVAGKIYFYEVVAVNPAGPGSPSTEVSGQAVFLTVPSVMGSPKASTVGDGIYLSWKPPGSDGGSPIVGYVLCRGSTPSSITNCVQFGANSTSYTDTRNLLPAQTYYYTISAVNSQGQSDPSVSSVAQAPQILPPQSPLQDPLFLTVLSIVAGAGVTVAVALITRERRKSRLEVILSHKTKKDDAGHAYDELWLEIENTGTMKAIHIQGEIANAQGTIVKSFNLERLAEKHKHEVSIKGIPAGERVRVNLTYKHPESEKLHKKTSMLTLE